MSTPTPLYDRAVETEIVDMHGDVVGMVYHHGSTVTVVPYRRHFELDHTGASRMAAAIIALH